MDNLGPFFRGVSKNGLFGWQIMCMVGRRQLFIATVDNKEMAAIIHDIISIQNNGLGVKTNFSYSMLDLIAISMSQSFLDVRNIQAN